MLNLKSNSIFGYTITIPLISNYKSQYLRQYLVNLEIGKDINKRYKGRKRGII